MDRFIPDGSCPICGSEKRMGKRAKRLYDVFVCRKCYYKVANRRQIAFIIDYICYIIIAMLVGYSSSLLLTQFIPATGSSSELVFVLFAQLADYACYGILLFRDAFRGRGPGKLICGLRTVDPETFEPCSVFASVKRNLPILIPIVPLVLAFTLQRGIRWGDGWAKTKVIWIKHEFKLPFDRRGIRCTGCGYDLTGNVSGRCPECGTVVPAGAVPPLAEAVRHEGSV